MDILMSKKNLKNPKERDVQPQGENGSKNELVTPELKQIISRFQNLIQEAFVIYSPLVDDIIRKKSQNKNEIEHLLDGILDFCFDDKMLKLFKKLCRYFYYIDPKVTADYIYLYRDMWDETFQKQ
ncbi:MAG: hypothetical protein ACD_79C00027G0001 [uncultured bacterium]|nr:MAG: hypothetical protein ACD_79C00027G0001 [uncultured bacterium]